MRHALVLCLALIGCQRASTAPPPAASSVPVATVAPPPPVTVASSATSFLHVAALPVGPVAVKGYPHNFRNGMNDPASFVGFSADSVTFAYCYETGGAGGMSCGLLMRDGSSSAMRAEMNDKKRQAEIDKFLKDEKIAPVTDKGPMTSFGPPLTGQWAYTDITLDVALIAASGPDGQHPAHIKIGGSVAGEAPVHPITLSSNPVPQAPPHFAALNGFALSPDGTEFAMLGQFFACEFCDSFDLKRMKVGALASLVYNDTGFRHHQKKDWAGSAALFEKAVAADPTAKLPAYNLACAWARLGDARTKDALAYALKLDPTVLVRAQTDDDLASVRAEPWFPR